MLLEKLLQDSEAFIDETDLGEDLLSGFMFVPGMQLFRTRPMPAEKYTEGSTDPKYEPKLPDAVLLKFPTRLVRRYVPLRIEVAPKGDVQSPSLPTEAAVRPESVVNNIYTKDTIHTQETKHIHTTSQKNTLVVQDKPDFIKGESRPREVVFDRDERRPDSEKPDNVIVEELITITEQLDGSQEAKVNNQVIENEKVIHTKEESEVIIKEPTETVLFKENTLLKDVPYGDDIVIVDGGVAQPVEGQHTHSENTTEKVELKNVSIEVQIKQPDAEEWGVNEYKPSSTRHILLSEKEKQTIHKPPVVKNATTSKLPELTDESREANDVVAIEGQLAEKTLTSKGADTKTVKHVLEPGDNTDITIDLGKQSDVKNIKFTQKNGDQDTVEIEAGQSSANLEIITGKADVENIVLELADSEKTKQNSEISFEDIASESASGQISVQSPKAPAQEDQKTVSSSEESQSPQSIEFEITTGEAEVRNRDADVRSDASTESVFQKSQEQIESSVAIDGNIKQKESLIAKETVVETDLSGKSQEPIVIEQAKKDSSVDFESISKPKQSDSPTFDKSAVEDRLVSAEIGDQASEGEIVQVNFESISRPESESDGSRTKTELNLALKLDESTDNEREERSIDFPTIQPTKPQKTTSHDESELQQFETDLITTETVKHQTHTIFKDEEKIVRDFQEAESGRSQSASDESMAVDISNIEVTTEFVSSDHLDGGIKNDIVHSTKTVREVTEVTEIELVENEISTIGGMETKTVDIFSASNPESSAHQFTKDREAEISREKAFDSEEEVDGQTKIIKRKIKVTKPSKAQEKIEQTAAQESKTLDIKSPNQTNTVYDEILSDSEEVGEFSFGASGQSGRGSRDFEQATVSIKDVKSFDHKSGRNELDSIFDAHSSEDNFSESVLDRKATLTQAQQRIANIIREEIQSQPVQSLTDKSSEKIIERERTKIVTETVDKLHEIFDIPIRDLKLEQDLLKHRLDDQFERKLKLAIEQMQEEWRTATKRMLSNLLEDIMRS